MIDDCISLEDALKLSTEFSVHSAAGSLPDDLEVPVPTQSLCRFVARPWSEVSDAEREAFHRFYQRVGGDLEDLALKVRQGFDLDEVTWREITEGLDAAETEPDAEPEAELEAEPANS